MTDADPPLTGFGEFRLDSNLRCLYRGSEKLKIGAMAFNVLEFLVKNRHRVVSKSEFLAEVWGEERTKGTVEQAISQLRRVLQDDTAEPQFIETVPGHGYRFVAQVLALDPKLDEPHQTPPDDGRGLASPTNDISAAGLLAIAGRPWAFARPGRFAILCIVIILLGVGAAMSVITHSHDSEIASATAVGDTLTAKDAAGNVVWTHRFDHSFMERPDDSKKRIQVVDLNGDGGLEVLVATAFADPTSANGPEELLCFSSRGKLLWRYRPEIDMKFNTRDLNGPWRIAQMIIVDEGRSKSIWLAVDHAIWWPAFLVKISPNGAREIRFTSSGAIYGLVAFHAKSGAYVMAGGINNEYRMAVVAVLALNGSPATSPQGDGSKFQCIRGCPTSQPYRYILLPRSETNIASDLPYNDASQILLKPGGFTIRTTEVEAAAQFFDFTEDFQPERVVYSGDYQAKHRRYELTGRITHSFDLCPERRKPAIVRIFDEKGVPHSLSVLRLD